MLWHSEVIADFVKSIFSLIQEDSHFLAKTDVYRLSRTVTQPKRVAPINNFTLNLSNSK